MYAAVEDIALAEFADVVTDVKRIGRRADAILITTYPKHFHNGDEAIVEESFIPDDPETAIRYFLGFVRDQLAAHRPPTPSNADAQ